MTTSHLLLGIWSEENSAGHKLLASYGFDDEKARKLAKTVSFLLFLISYSKCISVLMRMLLFLYRPTRISSLITDRLQI